MITYSYDIDMSPGGVPIFIHLNQYDDDFSIVFSLYSSSGAFSLVTGTEAVVRGTKRDGNGYSADCTIDTTNKTITVTGHKQMTAVAGNNTFELVLSRNTKVLSTANFILCVERAAMDAGTIVSDTVLKELNTIIAGADAATYAADMAEVAASRAEAAATALEVDDTLTQPGRAADAKAAGDELSDLKDELDEIKSGMSEDVKSALLACFMKVAWVDEHGRDYYNILESALYDTGFPKIVATFDPGLHVVYTDDALDTLKPYLTVTYYETRQSEGITIPASDYTLSGTLAVGTCRVLVLYNELSTSFRIYNVVDFYNTWTWSVLSGNMQKIVGSVDPNQSDTTKYPSRVSFREDVTTRRTYPVTRGKLPYYNYNQNARPSRYYPIPIPLGANHVKITMVPGQLIYMHTLPFDAANNQYLNSIVGNRISWTELSNGYIEKDVIRSDDNQLFMVLNSKYDSAGTSYPVEPLNMTVEFSEVS